jgi:hypothetical protein
MKTAHLRGLSDCASAVNYADFRTQLSTPVHQGCHPQTFSEEVEANSNLDYTDDSEDEMALDAVDSMLIEYDMLVNQVAQQSRLLADKQALIQTLEMELICNLKPLTKQAGSQTESEDYEIEGGRDRRDDCRPDSQLCLAQIKLADRHKEITGFKELTEQLREEIDCVRAQREAAVQKTFRLAAKMSKSEETQQAMMSHLLAQINSQQAQLAQSAEDKQQLKAEMQRQQMRSEAVELVMRQDKERLMQEVIRLQSSLIALQFEKTKDVSKISELETALLTKRIDEAHHVPSKSASVRPHSSLVDEGGFLGGMLDLIHNQSLTLRNQLEFFQELCLAKETRTKREQAFDKAVDAKGVLCTAEQLPGLMLPAQLPRVLHDFSCAAEDNSTLDALQSAEDSVRSLSQANAVLLERLSQAVESAEADTQTDLGLAAEEIAQENEALRDRVVALKRLYSKELIKNKLSFNGHTRKSSRDTSISDSSELYDS